MNITLDPAAVAKEIARELSAILEPLQPHEPVQHEYIGNNKLFANIRSRMEELSMDQEYLAKKIGLCRESLSGRMTGRVQWTLDEMYAAMDVLRIPYKHLQAYFPKSGKTEFIRKLTG